MVKNWGHRLKSKASADQLRKFCIPKLDPDSPLTINMAGVKSVSPGFSQEAFGKLFLEINKANSKIVFTCVSDEIRLNILSGIRAAINYHKGN